MRGLHGGVHLLPRGAIGMADHVAGVLVEDGHLLGPLDPLAADEQAGPSARHV